MEIECPECEFFSEVETEDLPDRACDSKEFECGDCGHPFQIGWYAEVELRK